MRIDEQIANIIHLSIHAVVLSLHIFRKIVLYQPLAYGV
jgi:hypothetical protein